ncbi:MAG TPA: phosphotransferase [Nocardioides sp.]|nr:phosphotransferase [Nocardioides sp.]
MSQEMDAARWTDAGWRAAAEEWVEKQLAALGLRRTGDVEQPHVMRWSTVLKVPTDAGAVWFKANDGTMRHEAALTDLLAARAPDRVPPLLAVDPESGWMLMADAGERLREVVQEERSLDRWHDVLASVARIQLACEDAVPELLSIGVPDLRLSALPDAYARLVHELEVEERFRAATPYVSELCERLLATGIAETVQHDDLHDAQVFVRGGANLVMDWGDACVTHPFLALSVPLEGVIAWGVDDEDEPVVDTAPFRDAYLAVYAEAYPALDREDLVRAVEDAKRLGWACRAVNGHIPGDEGSTHTRLRMFLDGRP